MFESRFTPTDIPDAKHSSALALFADGNRILPPPGVYNDGLLSILDEPTASELLHAWRWLCGAKCQALMTTGFGDVYYWDQTDRAVYFLNVQHAITDFVDRSIPWILDEFFAIPDIQESVLRASVLTKLAKEHRPLSCDECFILAPWQMFGGDESEDDFEIGTCSVYVDLVGQAQDNLRRE